MTAHQIRDFIKQHHPRRGQGMVEFALVLPILLFLVFGIMEGGRLLFIYTAITAAGREAARYGAGIGQLSSSGPALYNDCDGIRSAAMRIGFIAGINASEVHIFHDTGPGTTQTEYCTSSNPSMPFGKGNRIYVKISTPYSPIVPLLPIPSMNLHSENAHTILEDAEVKAVEEPPDEDSVPVCHMYDYSISTSGGGVGPSVNVTAYNKSAIATNITNVLAVWDQTGGPVLLKIISPSGGVITSFDQPTTGPIISKDVSWSLPAKVGSVDGNTSFTIVFSRVLKNPVVIQLTIDNPAGCTFGR